MLGTRLLVVFTSAVVTASIPCSGSGIKEMPLETLAHGSDLVVVGHYDSTKDTTETDPATKIPITKQVVYVSSCLRMIETLEDAQSSCPATVTVRAIGGRVPAYDKDGDEMIGPDGRTIMLEVDDSEAMPRLTKGAHVLFLSRQGVPSGQYRLYGYRKGMRRIDERTDGTRTVTVPIYNWHLLSDNAKALRTNTEVKSARDASTHLPARKRPPLGSLPRGPYYSDTISLDRLLSLLERIATDHRSQPVQE